MFLRIFPQTWTGPICSQCHERHGVREWRHQSIPGRVFGSKKCLAQYLRTISPPRRKAAGAANVNTKPNQIRETKMPTAGVIAKARSISKHTQEYCEKHGGRDHKPGDVLPYLVKMGVFNQVDQRNGSQLRKILREVYKAGMLEELIPQCRGDQGGANISWYFNKV